MNDKRTIETRPAAALFGSYFAAVVIGLLNKYAGYDPSVDEALGIAGLAAFVASWAIPERWWGKATEPTV
jgi:hypothetical protein